MAFKTQAEQVEKPFSKITDIPLLRDYAKDKKFCKSGLFQVEHIIPPGRFKNFTLVNYSINVRVNISPANEEAYKFLLEYVTEVDKKQDGHNWLGCQISNRLKGFVSIGIDDEKAVDWAKHALGYALPKDEPF